MGVLPTMDGSCAFEAGARLGLSATDAWSGLLPVMIQKLYLAELDRLSNVINDHRARLGSMREKNNTDKNAPDTEQPRDKPDLSLSISGAPAPIDIVAFGKRLGEIITKAVRASRTRSKPRK
jgi:hypothetical protein